MDDNHDEIAELLGAYALDAVDDDERVAVEAHLAECPRCAAEVADHREVAAMLAYSGAPAPEGVWSKIVDSLEEQPPALDLPGITTPSPPTSGVDELAARRERRERRPLLLGAVAAALLVIGLVAGVAIGANDDPASPDSEFALDSIDAVARRVFNDPDAAKVTLSSPDGEDLSATAAVESDGSGYLLGTSLPALGADETYQLWGVLDGTVVSLGVLGHSPDVVAFHLDPATETLAVTIETAGGVPVSSNPAVLVGSVA
ncbi:anti-sigma factor domain-containing protein [Actinospongicola halichondriae]|uniref:anti-sigma factor n=1 Tax=Actinospongicola halichondriae TaxID=3236844 RepID=UPI003D583A6D